jgi:hypothetical protein
MGATGILTGITIIGTTTNAEGSHRARPVRLVALAFLGVDCGRPTSAALESSVGEPTVKDVPGQRATKRHFIR